MSPAIAGRPGSLALGKRLGGRLLLLQTAENWFGVYAVVKAQPADVGEPLVGLRHRRCKDLNALWIAG